MKRSAVNQAIAWAKDYLQKNNIHLPEYAYWPLETWKANAGKLDTVRNGSIDDKSVGVPFCEKYIVMRDGQRLTNHYHVAKTEDIINRAGGTLRLYLWKVDPATGKMTDEDVDVYMDGVLHTFKAGEEVLVEPGNSISLTPYIAHIFGPKPGSDLVVGEVSSINDDNTDNYFLEECLRYTTIEDDEPMTCPLCNEYDKAL